MSHTEMNCWKLQNCIFRVHICKYMYMTQVLWNDHNYVIKNVKYERKLLYSIVSKLKNQYHYIMATLIYNINV